MPYDGASPIRWTLRANVLVHVQEVWWGTPRGYAHGVVFVFRGDVAGDPDPAWTPDRGEIVQVAWRDPEALSEATTRSLHWPALRKAGVV